MWYQFRASTWRSVPWKARCGGYCRGLRRARAIHFSRCPHVLGADVAPTEDTDGQKLTTGKTRVRSMDRLSRHAQYRPCTGNSGSTENLPLEMLCRSEFSKAATSGESVRGRRAFRVPSKEAASPWFRGGGGDKGPEKRLSGYGRGLFRRGFTYPI